jgi:uncharacterized membrane protein YgcG
VALAGERDRAEELTDWERWVAAVFVILALAGCSSQGTTDKTGARYAPYSPASKESVPEHGGGDGGGGGGAGM